MNSYYHEKRIIGFPYKKKQFSKCLAMHADYFGSICSLTMYLKHKGETAISTSIPIYTFSFRFSTLLIVSKVNFVSTFIRAIAKLNSQCLVIPFLLVAYHAFTYAANSFMHQYAKSLEFLWNRMCRIRNANL